MSIIFGRNYSSREDVLQFIYKNLFKDRIFCHFYSSNNITDSTIDQSNDHDRDTIDKEV